MHIKGLIAGLFVAGLLASCAPSIAVKYDFNPKVNVRQFSTYRIEADRQRNADPIMGSSLNQRRIAEALDQSLQGLGYKPTEDLGADLIIRFFTDSKDRQQVQSTGMGSPYGWGGWGWGGGYGNQVYSRQYEENRVVINVYDSRTNEIIWQGWASGQLNTKRRAEDRDLAFRETVVSIMKNFPQSAGQDYGNAQR